MFTIQKKTFKYPQVLYFTNVRKNLFICLNALGNPFSRNYIVLQELYTQFIPLLSKISNVVNLLFSIFHRLNMIFGEITKKVRGISENKEKLRYFTEFFPAIYTVQHSSSDNSVIVDIVLLSSCG